MPPPSPPPVPPAPQFPATRPCISQMNTGCICTCGCPSCNGSTSSTTDHASAPEHDLPTVPLYTPTHLRPHVPLMVFGYALTPDEILAFGERHGLGDSSDEYQLYDAAMDMIGEQLPRGKRRRATVWDPKSMDLATCFAVGGNLNSERLEMAKDWELVKQMQKALETDELPQWYHARPNF
ncbi:hypothetical protein A0H81_05288 [Grifola frondosa]|uniref:Uncharacterized protein n=1 Tax=Grifola frondosa TaxID=5627 RepID=A0A1C7MHX1_GRIFR|nr:hypothetical protein A0H81_05288 [Grifola frondosa]